MKVLQILAPFLLGASLGVASVYFWLGQIKKQEVELAYIAAEGYALRELTNLIKSFKTRGENQSFEEFVNCKTVYEFLRLEDIYYYRLDQFNLAKEARVGVAIQLTESLEVAKTTLIADKENFCKDHEIADLEEYSKYHAYRFN